MLTLTKLPGEVLCQILAAEHSHCVLSLWKCGDAALNQRLERSITHLDLRDSRQGSTSRWPILIERFSNLRSLAVDRGDWPLGPTSIVRNSLQKLSSSLLSLKLIGANAQLVLLKEEHCSVEEGPADTEVELPTTSLESAEESRAWNIGATFPSLESFEIEGYFSLAGLTLSRLRIADLAVLPQTLRRLILFDEMNGSDLSVLPRNLEVLDTSFIGRTLDLRTLPPNLQSIKAEIAPSAIDDLLTSEAAASGALQTAGESGGRFDIATVDLYFYNGTSPLQWNSISAVDFASWEQVQQLTMPSTITLLGLWDVSVDFTVFMLPATLKHLASTDLPEWEGVSASQWPKQLVSLYLDNAHRFGPLHFHRLPRTLTYLYAAAPTDALLYGLKRESPEAASLQLKVEALGVASLAAHPQETVILDSFASSHPNWTSKANVDAIKAGRHFGLPINLRSFTFGAIGDWIDLELVLPPFVRHADVPTAFCQHLSSLVTSLPLLIEKLDLDLFLPKPPALGPNGVKPASFVDFSLLTSLKFATHHIVPQTFALLPPNLTILALVTTRTTHIKITSKMLSELPQTLTTLMLPLYPHPEDTADWIGSLPRRLRRGHFEHWHAPGKNLALLPPRITSFTLSTLAPCSQEDFKLLPPSLTQISAQCISTAPEGAQLSSDLILNPWVTGKLGDELQKATPVLASMMRTLLKG